MTALIKNYTLIVNLNNYFNKLLDIKEKIILQNNEEISVYSI